MKKCIFFAVTASAFLLFPGCEFLKNLLPKEDSIPVLPVKKVETFRITEQDTDISTKVQKNSRVYVVQVNESNKNADSFESGTLKNEIPFPEYESESSRAAAFDQFLVNEKPLFIDYSHLKEKASQYKEGSSLIRSSVYRSIGEETANFNVPLSNGYNPDYTTLYDCELKYESKHAYVYFAPNVNMYVTNGMEDDYDLYEEYLSKCNSLLTDYDFRHIGTVFDSIYEAETKLLGSNRNFLSIDGFISPSSSGKVTILLDDIYNDSKANQTGGTFGYFNGKDFLRGSDSNEAQIIYIDSVLYRKYPETALSTLAHEFGHLLNFCNKEMKTKTNSVENTWFTEMLAMLSEDLLFENVLKSNGIYNNTVIKNRIPYYNSFHSKGITSWNPDESLPYYGNAFAFGSFLVRNYGGPELVNRIATNSYFNESAVTNALSSMGYSKSFKEVVREFALSSMNYKLASNAESSVKSLNKSAKWSQSGTTFKAGNIDVSAYNNNKSGNGLNILKNKNTTSLGAYGFSVQYAGEGVKKISVTLPESDDLKMYCVIQHFDK